MYVRERYTHMGKSYADKVKTRQKKNSNRRTSPKRTMKDDPRKDKFPLAPVLVLVVVISLIIATIVVYQVQNSNDGDDGPNGGNNGGNGGGPSSDLPMYSSIRIENVNGGLFSLDQYKGKMIVLDMFATWCDPCADQMVELQKLRSVYSENEVVILSVDVDLRETTNDVLKFRSDFPGANWVFGMSNSEFNKFFPAASIPTMYILNKEQNIVETEVGVTSSESLQVKINSHL
jgi:thiol-disulfide isomerase/thioredoxin